MNRYLPLFTLLLLCGCISPGVSAPSTGSIHIEQTAISGAGTLVNVEIVYSGHDKEIGLTEHANLQPNEGMWFIFDESKAYPFWTKGMDFPIDIIWVDENYKIVDLKENLQPCNIDSCAQYRAKVPIRYALEVPAGFVRSNRIQIGKTIDVDWE